MSDRKIKFRGQILDGERKGEWVYGWYIREARGLINGLPAINLSQAEIVSFIVYSEEGQLIIHEVDPKTVGQYINLKDRNEVELYEGDNIKIGELTTFVIPNISKIGLTMLYDYLDRRIWIELINPDLLTQ